MERRRHFLVNKPLQFRFMAFLIVSLMTVTSIIVISLYFGIWGGVLDALSNEQVRDDLLIASRLTQYEEAHTENNTTHDAFLSWFKQTEKLSARQREVFKKILDDTNAKLLQKLLILLILIAWGSIYLSHKIAGPLYRFYLSMESVGNGDLKTRVVLRRGDEAQILAERFNQTLEIIDLSMARIKNIVKENEGNAERMAAKLKDELAKFKTSADL